MLSYDQSTAPFAPGSQNPKDNAPTASAKMQPSASANGHVVAGTWKQTRHQHIFIVYGPAGSGKSTVAKDLSRHFSLPYIEGDEYHPVANIEKMANGVPLTDADRWDWLILLRQEAVNQLSTGAPGVVLTCSALKKKYRDVIRIASLYHPDVIVHYIYLKAHEDILLARVKARQGHYMKDSMVRSQIRSLEEPEAEETDVLAVDVSGSMTEVAKLAVDVVEKTLLADAA